MKIRFVFLVFIVFSNAFSFARRNVQLIDSLIAQLPNTKIDSIKLKIYKDIIKENYYSSSTECDSSQVTYYAKVGERLAKKIGFKEDIAKIYWYMGGFYTYKTSNYSLAKHYYNRMMNIYQSINNVKGIADGFECYGKLAFQQNDFTEAANYFYKGIKIAESVHYDNLLARIYRRLGLLYYTQKDYNALLEVSKKGLEIAQKLDSNSTSVIEALNNIGIVYQNRYDSLNAEQYFARALKVSLRIKDTTQIAVIYGNIAGLRRTQNLEGYLQYLDFMFKIKAMYDVANVEPMNRAENYNYTSQCVFIYSTLFIKKQGNC